MAAYWLSVEHEMKLRRKTLLQGANHLEWENDPELIDQAKRFHDRYLADMKELVEREGIVPARTDRSTGRIQAGKPPQTGQK